MKFTTTLPIVLLIATIFSTASPVAVIQDRDLLGIATSLAGNAVGAFNSATSLAPSLFAAATSAAGGAFATATSVAGGVYGTATSIVLPQMARVEEVN